MKGPVSLLVPPKGMLDPSVGGNIGPGPSVLSFDLHEKNYLSLGWASAAN